MSERNNRIVPLSPDFKADFDPNRLLYFTLKRAIRYSVPGESIIVAKCPTTSWTGLVAGSNFHSQLQDLESEHIDFCAEGHEIALTLLHLNDDRIRDADNVASGAIHHLDNLAYRLRKQRVRDRKSIEDWLLGEGKPVSHLYNKD